MRVYLLAALVFVPALASAQQPCTPDARRVVDAVYQQVLERQAGGEGANMVEQLTSGQTTVRELIRAVAKSTEHHERFISSKDAGNSVNYLYKHLLGRTADPNGMRTHLLALNRDGVETVIDSLISSDEYQRGFGENTVPGARISYCGANSTSNTAGARMRFAGMDRNRNGSIELDEWNGSRQSFNVHDWNRDSVLSGDEVRPGARRRARPSAEDDFNPAGPGAWTAQDFQQVDRNRDNRITSSEWFWDAESFRRADRNRDGVLVVAEFTAAESTWDDDRADQFVNLDVNRNGRVERSEWHGSADAFDWLDGNNDNVLTRVEVVGDNTAGQFDSFATLDANSNGTLSVAEWRWSRRSFVQYDANGDGVLSRQEFNASGGPPTAVR